MQVLFIRDTANRKARYLETNLWLVDTLQTLQPFIGYLCIDNHWPHTTLLFSHTTPYISSYRRSVIMELLLDVSQLGFVDDGDFPVSNHVISEWAQCNYAPEEPPEVCSGTQD